MFTVLQFTFFTKSLGAFFPRLILGQGKHSEKKVIFLSFGAKVFDKEVQEQTTEARNGEKLNTYFITTQIYICYNLNSVSNNVKTKVSLHLGDILWVRLRIRGNIC